MGSFFQEMWIDGMDIRLANRMSPALIAVKVRAARQTIYEVVRSAAASRARSIKRSSKTVGRQRLRA
jgi:hypothetical protein